MPGDFERYCLGAKNAFFQDEQGVGSWCMSVSVITRHKNIIKQTEESLMPILRALSFDEDVTLKFSNDCVSYKSLGASCGVAQK